MVYERGDKVRVIKTGEVVTVLEGSFRDLETQEGIVATLTSDGQPGVYYYNDVEPVEMRVN